MRVGRWRREQAPALHFFVHFLVGEGYSLPKRHPEHSRHIDTRKLVFVSGKRECEHSESQGSILVRPLRLFRTLLHRYAEPPLGGSLQSAPTNYCSFLRVEYCFTVSIGRTTNGRPYVFL